MGRHNNDLLAAVERALLDLDLLVEVAQLVVALGQLRAEDVSLVDHDVVLLLLLEPLGLGFVND